MDKRFVRQIPERADGEYLLSPAGVLLITARTVYCSPDECTAVGLERATRLLSELMASASSRGFTQGDIFQTLIASGGTDARVKEMALEIVKRIGDDYLPAIERAGVSFGPLHDGQGGVQ